jgi:WD40 repeat protein
VVRIYALPSGDLVEEFTPTTSAQILALAWSQDGSTMAVSLAGENAGTSIIDRSDGIFTKSDISLDPSIPYQLSSDGAFLVGVMDWDDVDVQILDTTTFQIVTTLTGHTDRINSIQCVDDSIVTVSWDGTTRFWNPENGQQIRQLDTGLISPPSFSPDGTRFVASGDDMIAIRDATTGEIIVPLVSNKTNSKVTVSYFKHRF